MPTDTYMYALYSSLAYCKPDEIQALYTDVSDVSEDAKLVRKCIELPTFINNEETHTQGYVFKTTTEVVIACRGTDNLYDCFDDLQVCLVPLKVPNHAACNVHEGFLRQSNGLLKIIKTVIDEVHAANMKLVFTGHSLGGAIATICSVIVSAQTSKDVFVHAYGSPKVGDAQFKAVFEKLITNCILVKYGADPFTKVMIGDVYQHVSPFKHYGPIDHHPKLVLLSDAFDHNIKNYVHAEQSLPTTETNWWQKLIIKATTAILSWLK